MKKLIYGGLLLAAVLVGVIGCKKEIRDPNKQNRTETLVSNQSNMGNLKTGGGSITVIKGVLKFQNFAQVQSTIESLNQEYRNHENSFINQYPNISGDSLMIIEEAIGYNEFEAFEDFEQLHNYNSLRKVLFEHETNWLNSDQSTAEPVHPMDYIIDDGLQTILNSNAELIVGDTIYKIYPNGYVHIPNLDFVLLEEYRNSSNPEYIEGGKKVGFEKSTDCRGHVSYPSIGWLDSKNGNARIKYKVAIRTLPWNRYVIAKTKAYKKRNWLGWKRVRTFIRSSVYGSVSDWSIIDGKRVANCEKQLEFNSPYPQGYYAENSNVKSLHHKISVFSRTKSTWVKGYHHIYFGPFTKTSTLIW